MPTRPSAPTEPSPAPSPVATAVTALRRAWLAFGIAAVVSLVFALFTRHVWEDFYITYRASKNLAIGNGLTFTVGERVHSFTSPLGTLLPALASVLAGNSSDTAALWIFRVMSIAAFGGCAVMFWSIGRRFALRAFPAWLLVLLLATDAKTVDFTINGMETPYTLLFLGWTLYATFFNPSRRVVQLGLAWAGLMWCRPDSFVYIGLIAIGALLFGRFEHPSRGRVALLKEFVLAGLITTAVYGPWLLWAWWYYGSPIPHTIVAKGLLMPKPTVSGVLQWFIDFPLRIVRTGASLGTTFMPPYALGSGWPNWALRASFYVSVAVMALWFVPRVRWEVRVTSFAFVGGHFYLNYFSNFYAPWYVPTLSCLAFVSIAGVVGQLLPEPGARLRWSARGAIVAVCAFLGGATVLLGCTAWQMRMAQRINEDSNRRVMAEWLHDHASSPKDTVFIECLGYVGFFSNLKMYDWPGLSSTEVVAVRRKSTTLGDYTHYFPEIITALEPDWVVLRSSEVYQVNLIDHDLLTRYYTLVKVFDSGPQIAAVKFLPGRKYLEFDSHFEVYHRRDVGGLKEHIPVKVTPITVDNLIINQTWAGPAYESKGSIAAHAPSRLTVAVPPGAERISGAFGFYPGAYEKGAPNTTFGGIFTITAIAADGSKRQIFLAALDPANRAKDRGDQTFVAPITLQNAKTVELSTEPPPGKGNAYGWTYWTNLKFETPKKP